MELTDLTETEKRVWQAARTGTLVDLRAHDPEIDSPEKWTEWAPERTVRAEVIADLLIGDGEAASVAVRGVRLQGARITGDLNLEGTTLRCPLALLDCYFANAINLKEATAVSVRLGGSHFPAIRARQLQIRGDLRLDKVFCVSGEVKLGGAHISGVLDCAEGQFSNPNGFALNADGLTVGGDMFCSEGFAATGGVRLIGAHISGDLDCHKGQFSNPGGDALIFERATVSGHLHMQSAVVQGIFDLTATKTSSFSDDPASWPQKLRLDGFVYDAIDGASAKERLEKSEWLLRNKSGYSPQIYERLERSGWLLRNESGYSPQIYDQLAAAYRRAGHDDDARRVLIEKQRRRFAQRNLGWRWGGYLLDVTVGYGYRTWLAAFWLIGFLILGTWLFGDVYRGDLTPANKTNVPPLFQPFIYTLDLLLPVVSLHVRDAWAAQGIAQWLSVIFIVIGWILATSVVLSLTGLLKRD